MVLRVHSGYMVQGSNSPHPQCPKLHFHYRQKGLLVPEPLERGLQHAVPIAFPSDVPGDQPTVPSNFSPHCQHRTQ